MTSTTAADAPTRLRWFVVGDWNAFFALVLDNMVNLVVFAGILVGAFGFPREVIFERMIPGTAFGVLVGDVLYTLLAVQLMRRTGRQDVTAMPLGLDTPSTIGMALAVLGPAFLAIKGDLLAGGVATDEAVQRAAISTWHIGMAVMVLMGLVKVALSFIGEWVRKRVPQAGLLGSIGGIGLALLCFFPLLDIFQAPVIGLAALGLVLYALVARIELPFRLPGAVMAVVVGTALYYALGPAGLLGIHFTAPTFESHLALPWPTLAGFTALGDALPYLPIAVPFGLLTIVGGINTTESARAAGDDYDTQKVLLAEAVATLAAGLTGGVAQSTPYIGQPAYKQMGARAGYTLMTGLVVGLGGALGYVSFIVGVLPAAAVVPLLLFVGLEITAQAFHVCPQRHAPAIAFSFLPIIADLLLIRQDQMLGSLHGAIAGAGLGDKEGAMHALVNGVADGMHAHVLAGLGHGFILTAMMWGSFFALIIDRELKKASVFIALTGVMTLFGIVHSMDPAGGMYLKAPVMALQWAAGYFVLAALTLGLSFKKP